MISNNQYQIITWRKQDKAKLYLTQIYLDRFVTNKVRIKEKIRFLCFEILNLWYLEIKNSELPELDYANRFFRNGNCQARLQLKLKAIKKD